MADKVNPINPTDDAARALARRLIDTAETAALATLHPDTGAPWVSRIAIATDPLGTPVTLVSALAQHTGALAADPRAAILVGEPGAKGDPLNHPRLTLTVRARFLDRNTADHAALRAVWLKAHPKSTLYVDFPDFRFVRLTIESGALNGGFARAYLLGPQDF